ncbi:hypothetical protein TBLA_0A07590 [Henningerozyma blattae CBS 6284]|uniref:Alpha box domain-containing protein n=1 Tax=Henningerozyma blattae (strain ATCC 34711 / CBS 6284 / DSM 70876 / NBRC 10599 / NRRL Y-10934 / UCD 77-7) TaxID=1071380 RepID=I2GWP7_HENB6|nr:hypothetical protein TBLA_0A07040 [Tetrapisispora blattae CBS 6284]XP_004178068.1 hypothetical protein TBLA_0A07590 [Tetrapisispora blattae CBS 6284]CCH58495.1 hypothetical protein TBLA_0A07040 [Tetrapisispora blattae CBS 6284]CCH58549.1 hypothetical protein TBLA_0A07590 [Tetrapisispora blattae CBS 6284]
MSNKTMNHTKKALFKVNLKLNKNIRMKTNSKSMRNKFNETRGISILLYKNHNIKIPFPPTTLLYNIEVEKQKIISTQHMLNEYTMDNDDNYLSDLFYEDEYNDNNSLFDNGFPNNVNSNPNPVNSERVLNGFIAFRAYNSQFGYGLKQNILSSLLSTAWHENPNQQNVWNFFSQEYNFVKPKCGFVEWLGQTYEREMHLLL